VQRYRVIVIEDSPTMRQLLVFALKRIPGVTCEEAEDGVAALEMLRQGGYHLMVSDVNMPRMDGFELLQKVRADEALKGLPIIMITTESAITDQERALSLGANAYITKPVQARQVVQVASKFLQSGR
jgi:two-component system chemotaxis response regulator CheY